MNTRLQFLRCSLLAVLLAALLPGATPAFAAEEVAAQAVAKETRCPVCGMYPARYPKWMAQVAFKDRAVQAFDSPADLFRFLHNMAKYDTKHGNADIGAIYLTDHAKGGWIEAKRAFLVAGSSARGPMNNADLPAFDGKVAAEQFAKANGGKVLAFDQVTPEVVGGLDHEHPDHGGHDHGHHGH